MIEGVLLLNGSDLFWVSIWAANYSLKLAARPGKILSATQRNLSASWSGKR